MRLRVLAPLVDFVDSLRSEPRTAGKGVGSRGPEQEAETAGGRDEHVTSKDAGVIAVGVAAAIDQRERVDLWLGRLRQGSGRKGSKGKLVAFPGLELRHPVEPEMANYIGGITRKPVSLLELPDRLLYVDYDRHRSNVLPSPDDRPLQSPA